MDRVAHRADAAIEVGFTFSLRSTRTRVQGTVCFLTECHELSNIPVPRARAYENTSALDIAPAVPSAVGCLTVCDDVRRGDVSVGERPGRVPTHTVQRLDWYDGQLRAASCHPPPTIPSVSAQAACTLLRLKTPALLSKIFQITTVLCQTTGLPTPWLQSTTPPPQLLAPLFFPTTLNLHMGLLHHHSRLPANYYGMLL